MMNAGVTEDTRSKQRTQLASWKGLLELADCPIGEAVEFFLTDYVPNHMKGGHGHQRRASGLKGAYSSLLGGLRDEYHWEPTDEQRQRYTRLRKAVMKRYSRSTMVHRAEPVRGYQLRHMMQHIPEEAANPDWYRTVVYVLDVMRLMWQGLLRFGDLVHIDVHFIEHRFMTVDGTRVPYYLLHFQDKQRHGSTSWRQCFVPKRADVLDAYNVVKFYSKGRTHGPLFTELVRGWFDKVIQWMRVEADLPKLKGHGFRSGGNADLLDELPDVRLSILQGGWGAHTEAEELYKAVQPAQHLYFRLTSKLLRVLVNMGRGLPEGVEPSDRTGRKRRRREAPEERATRKKQEAKHLEYIFQPQR